MSRYRALRGVCVSPGKHLVAGDTTSELDRATAQYLLSIKAVEEVKDEPVKSEPPKESVPEKTGKPKEK